MSNFDSNYNYLRCPFCEERITEALDKNDNDITYLDEDEDYDFFKCPSCERYVKVELLIYKEHEFISSKPTEEEIEQHNLFEDEDDEEDKDVDGQIFMWD